MNPEKESAQLIASLLNEEAQRLDMRTTARLEKARSQAVEMHAKKQTIITNAGTGQLVMGYLQHHRMLFSSVIVIFLATLTFVAEQKPVHMPDMHSDAFLLGSELPPEAYVDRGFDSWLATK